jgi:DNA repair protein RadA
MKMTKEKKIEKVEELPGVGAATAEKLKDAGFHDLLSIAVASPGILAEAAGMGEAASRKVINAARNSMNMGFESGDVLLKKRENIKKITTCSKNLDSLLGGGIETNAITEFFGEYGSGKSSLAHQLAVTVQLPKEKGGAEGMCVWVDSESTFRPERIKQIAEALSLNPEKTLKNIKVARAFNSDHQMLLVEKISDLVSKENLPIKLVIIDSLMSHFRSDFQGRGQLADRQQKLNRHMHDLLKLAEKYNVVIYITNQVMSKPDTFFGDPTAAIGGHVLAHACLTADSLIQLGDGSIMPVGDIKNNSPITSVSFKDFKTKRKQINQTFANINTKKIYDIITTSNIIKASPDHKFFKIENFEIKETAAKDLKAGDYIARINKLSFALTEQRLPEIEHKELFIVTDEGSNFIKKELNKLSYTRKDKSTRNICKHLNITARQLRRVLNQSYPTSKQNVMLLINVGVNNKVLEMVQPCFTNKHRDLIIPEYFTPEIAQILGYFIGDGCFEDHSLRFKDERIEVLEHYNKLFKKVFGVKGSISKVSKKNCFSLNINRNELKKSFETLKGNMFLYISKSPLENVKSFIRGFTDAEGCVSKDRPAIFIGQKNGLILRFIQLLLYRLGIHSNFERTSKKCSEFYSLHIEGQEASKFAREIGITAKDKKRLLEKWICYCDKTKDNSYFPILRKEIWNTLKEEGLYPSHFMASKPDKFMTLRNIQGLLKRLEKIKIRNIETKKKLEFIKTLVNSHIGWVKVKRIKKILNREVLYDISVPETKNYIANGLIVHNSTYRIYLRKGKKGTRVAKIVDAPHLPEGEAIFVINSEGIRDAELK